MGRDSVEALQQYGLESFLRISIARYLPLVLVTSQVCEFG